MKLLRILFLLFACQVSLSFCDAEDKIVDAIEASDPDILRGLIIPGFLIRLEDKKRYATLAHSVTNRTHTELQRLCFSDLYRTAKGMLYLVAGGVFGFLAAGNVADKSVWNALFNNAQGRIKIIFEADGGEARELAGAAQPEKKSFISKERVAGVLGALSLFFVGKSVGLFHDVLTKKSRLEKHNNALTVEAIILRLPAFDNGCFIPGSSG